MEGSGHGTACDSAGDNPEISVGGRAFGLLVNESCVSSH